MIFKGVGLVRWRGKKIANFIDGHCEVTNPAHIRHLQMIGFQEAVPTEEQPVVVVTEPAKVWVQKNKKKAKNT